MCNIYFINIDKFDEYFFEKIYNTSRKEIQDKVNKLKFKKDKQIALISNYMLTYCLNKSGIEKINIKLNKYGKKFLEDNPIYFNISHSNSLVTIIVSKSNVGIDIEKLEDIDYQSLCLEFAEKESNYIKNCGKQHIKKEFYRIWTSKESFVKYLGTGLLTPLKSFTVPTQKKQDKVIYKMDSKYIIANIKSYYVNEYSLSICGKNEYKDIKFFSINENLKLTEINNMDNQEYKIITA